jgi:hypothetical protein
MPTTKFKLGDSVLIGGIQCRSVIQKILIAQNGTTYEVAYWFNGERKECWCNEGELKPI